MVVLLGLVAPLQSTAFMMRQPPVVVVPSISRRNAARLFYSPHDDNGHTNDEDSLSSFSSSSEANSNNADFLNVYELERARSEFEHLLSLEYHEHHQSANNNNNENNNFHDAEFLSSNEESSSGQSPSSRRWHSKDYDAITNHKPELLRAKDWVAHTRRLAAEAASSNTVGGGSLFAATFPMDDEEEDDDGNEISDIMVWTNSVRRFREMELALLQTLRNSDTAIASLIHLWTTERDEVAAQALWSLQQQHHQHSNNNNVVVTEEDTLIALCRLHPGWAEPQARLAAILYEQGRLDEALVAAERAVAIKPWHFAATQIGALILHQMPAHCSTSSLLSSSTSARKHDEEMRDILVRAAVLARQTLPSLSISSNSANRRARQLWVDHAVAKATEQLQYAVEESPSQSSHFDYVENDDSYRGDEDDWTVATNEVPFRTGNMHAQQIMPRMMEQQSQHTSAPAPIPNVDVYGAWQ